MSSSFPKAEPTSDEERAALRELYAVLERVRPRLDAAVERAAAGIPAFSQLLRTLDPATREQQTIESRARERAALLDGEWAPYLESLRMQGALYAHMGVAFDDWYGLLRPYRDVIHAELLPPELTRERAALTGMGTLLDRAMAAIAASYSETKEELVRRAEDQLGIYIHLFEHTPFGKVIYEWQSPPDPGSFRRVAANAAATVMTGGRTVAALGERLQDAASHPLEAEMSQHLARAIETQEPQRWTLRTLQGDGEHIHDCRAFALGRSFAGVVFDDVTERRRMQETLARHAADLERSNRDLDEFAYVASHDLKAPLRDIDTLAGWIAEDAADALPEGSRRHLRTLQDRIARMEGLLDDLLQYSRAGRVRDEPEEIEIRGLVQNAIVLAGIPEEFEVSVTGDAPVIRAPRAALELVLRNLIANAAKHHHRPDGRVQIALAVVAPSIEIAVIDDGPGIAPEFHQRIFGMFQTLRPRDDVEGSGMGLAVVKKIAEAHGGRVELDSAPGRGSTFRVSWPIEPRRI